jgi:hypothetical protein
MVSVRWEEEFHSLSLKALARLRVGRGEHVSGNGQALAVDHRSPSRVKGPFPLFFLRYCSLKSGPTP